MRQRSQPCLYKLHRRSIYDYTGLIRTLTKRRFQSSYSPQKLSSKWWLRASNSKRIRDAHTQGHTYSKTGSFNLLSVTSQAAYRGHIADIGHYPVSYTHLRAHET